MKRSLCLLFMCFILLVNADCKAQQTCNPNYNSVITGVPYCKGIGTESVTTQNPDTINNAWKPDNNSLSTDRPIIYYSPIRPMAPYINNNMNSPSILRQDYYNNASPQVVPNGPTDNLPVEIPGSINSQNFY